MTRNRRTTSLIALLGPLTLLCVSCGDDDPVDPRAAPSGAGTFVEGDLDDVPVFRGATLIGGPTEKDGTRSATYEVVTATPETVLAFYGDALPQLGWTVLEAPVETNDQVWRGLWSRDGRELQVVASPLKPDPGGDIDTVTDAQLSLVLYDQDSTEVPLGTLP